MFISHRLPDGFVVDRKLATPTSTALQYCAFVYAYFTLIQSVSVFVRTFFAPVMMFRTCATKQMTEAGPNE